MSVKGALAWLLSALRIGLISGLCGILSAAAFTLYYRISGKVPSNPAAEDFGFGFDLLGIFLGATCFVAVFLILRSILVNAKE